MAPSSRDALAILAIASLACAATAALPKLALDTDLGTDFDDAWALTYLAAQSKPGDPHRLFDFALVQVSSFNTTKRALIAARMLHDIGRFDVPIAIGLYTGEDDMPQFGAVGNYTLEAFVADGGTVLQGTSRLEELMRAATPEAPLFVVEIAPATSLGGVVWAEPALAANVITAAMSGSVYHGYGNSSAPDAEYNVYTNRSASQKMYAAQWLSPLMTAPLDTSGLLRCTAPEYTNLLSAGASPGHPYATMLLRNYGVWCNCDPAQQGATDVLYDAQDAYQVRRDRRRRCRLPPPTGSPHPPRRATRRPFHTACARCRTMPRIGLPAGRAAHPPPPDSPSRSCVSP